MSISVITGKLASAVADDGTFTVNYPSGKNAGHFSLGVGHKISLSGYKTYEYPSGVFLTFGASNITVKNVSGGSWAADTEYRLQLEEIGDRLFRVGGSAYDRNKAAQLPVDAPSLVNNAWKGDIVMMSLGAPDTADADAMIKAATGTELPDTETVTYTPDTDGDSPTDGAQSVVTKNGVDYWELDVPRNVTVNTTHSSSIVAMTVKVTGLDEYENDMYEEITVAATGTDEDDAGLKAFKWVRSIAFTAAADAEANTCNVGFGDVLGLPVFLPDTGLVLQELEDGTAPTAGTLVAGKQTEGGATATDGDVRGTYDPNSAADGSKKFHLIACLPDPTYLGYAQKASA